MGYSYKPAITEEPRTAKARIEDVNVSWKDVANVCSNVRGRNAESALEFLAEAKEGKRPVRYFNYNKRRGHIGALGGKKGGYPKKSARIVYDVLRNAIANAEARGLGECKIVHIQANKQNVYGRMSPKGRRVRQDLETAFIEIVLREIPGMERKAEDVKKPATPKSDEKKAEEAKADEKKAEKKAEEKKVDEKKADATQTTAKND
jgi:large subunit ribosomal protein L17e